LATHSAAEDTVIVMPAVACAAALGSSPAAPDASVTVAVTVAVAAGQNSRGPPAETVPSLHRTVYGPTPPATSGVTSTHDPEHTVGAEGDSVMLTDLTLPSSAA